jgi:hypothetical protein
MLTLEVLYAVLLGVHPEQLIFLDDPWRSLCYDLFRQLDDGVEPLAALKLALQNLLQSHPNSVARLVKEMELARQLPGLSSRQKQALIALRYAKVASLKQLCKVLVADRRILIGACKSL